MGEELKPCPNPWCSGTIGPMPFVMRDGTWEVICGCDFHGPKADCRAEAIAAWNRRAAADLHKTLGEALEALEKSRARLVRIAGRDFNCSSHQHGMAAASHALIGVHEAEDAIASLQKALTQVEGGE